MISEHLAGSVVTDSVSHVFFFWQLENSPAGDVNGKTQFRAEAGASFPEQPDSIHLSAGPDWHFGCLLPPSCPAPSHQVPAFHSSPRRRPHPAHAYKNSPACLGKARPSDLSEGDFYGLFPLLMAI